MSFVQCLISWSLSGSSTTSCIILFHSFVEGLFKVVLGRLERRVVSREQWDPGRSWRCFWCRRVASRLETTRLSAAAKSNTRKRQGPQQALGANELGS